MKFFNNLKKNNKGFSLVELIIVIAIMAVLVGTLAPQYIRYVEKSREAADATMIDNFVSALEVISASPDAGLTANTEYTVTFNKTNGCKAEYNANLYQAGTNGAAASGLAIFSEIIDVNKTYQLKSSKYTGTTNNIVVKLSQSNNTWKVTVDNLPQ